jgi:hypothetical protein
MREEAMLDIGNATVSQAHVAGKTVPAPGAAKVAGALYVKPGGLEGAMTS